MNKPRGSAPHFHCVVGGPSHAPAGDERGEVRARARAVCGSAQRPHLPGLPPPATARARKKLGAPLVGTAASPRHSSLLAAGQQRRAGFPYGRRKASS